VNAPSARPDDAAGRRRRGRATSRWLRARTEIAWLFLLALAIRAAAALANPAILNDGAALLRSTSKFARSGWSAAATVLDHPLTPWLASKAPASVDPETAATALCVFAGALAVWPLHVLARRACGRHAATAACIVYAALPKAVGVASSPLTSAVLLPLFLGGLSLASVSGLLSPRRSWRILGTIDEARVEARRRLAFRLRALRRRRRWTRALRRPVRLVAAGLICGLAYLARPEGLLAAAAAIVVAWCVARRGSRLVSVAIVAAAFLVVAVPYAQSLSDADGRIVLSPKKDVARFVGAAPTPVASGSDVPAAVREAGRSLDGALTTPVLALAALGLVASKRWRRRRALGHRVLLVSVAGAVVVVVARLHAGWGYGGARHVLPGALLLVPFAGEGLHVLGALIRRSVARRRLSVVLASFLAIPLAVNSVLRPEGEDMVDARRLGERLAEIARGENVRDVVVATFREPLVAYYADRARRGEGGSARDVPLWGAFRELLERSDAQGKRAELAATLRREGAQWFVIDLYRRTTTAGGEPVDRGAALAQRLLEDGVLGAPVVSAGSELTAFPVKPTN